MAENPVLTYQKMGKLIEKQFKNFRGDLGEFESAVGALIIGQHMGWRVLLLAHDRRTIDKYGKMLGVDFKDGKTMPEVGKLAHKSLAWNAYQGVTNFWKAVKGEIAGIKTLKVNKA